MTEIVHSNAELDTYVRKRVGTVLVSGYGNSSRMLHLMSDKRWMEPACNTSTQRADDWLDKPVTVYLPDYFPFCSACAEVCFDVEVKYAVEVSADD